ncbi:hypothetical protein D3C86_1643460 [compost metagenome]
MSFQVNCRSGARILAGISVHFHPFPRSGIQDLVLVLFVDRQRTVDQLYLRFYIPNVVISAYAVILQLHGIAFFVALLSLALGYSRGRLLLDR